MLNFFKKSLRNDQSYWLILTGSAIGVLASLVLSYDTLLLARYGNQLLSCDLNAVVSCSTVANHWSASVFGIPNAFIGLVFMPVFVTIAVAGLAGTKFPAWFMRAAGIGAVLSALSAIWMFMMSYLVIGALCPWCLSLDVGVLLICLGIFRYSTNNQLCVPKKGKWAKFANHLVEKNYDYVAAISLAVLVIAMIIVKYGKDF